MKIFHLFLLFIWFSCTESLHELCAKQSFQNVYCGKQLWGENLDENTCEVKYYVTNSSTCSELKFDKPIDSLTYLGDVRIKPFMWDYNKHYYYTLFNITFTNIRWTSLKFRFQANGGGKEYKNHCRQISLSSLEGLNNSSSLSYDCYWSEQDRRYEKEKYYLDYEAEGNTGVARGRYIFIVPSVKTLSPVQSPDEWVPFIYLNVLDPRNVSIHIVPPDDSLNVNYYVVKVCLQAERSHRKKFVCTESSVEYAPGEEVVHLHQMITSGGYTFEITPISSDCPQNKCKPAFGPKIHIDLEQEGLVYSILWIALIFSVFWIPVIMWLAFKWRVSRKIRPNVLIIHPPGNKMDGEVVDLLTKYFKLELQWQLLLKEDIKSTNHDNPYIWCVDAFKKADVILYIVNPYTRDQAEVEYGENNIYTNLDQILLKHVRSGQNKCSIVNILFDHYKTRQVIPKELTHMKTFKLLKDWNQLIYFVMGYDFWDKISCPIPKLHHSESGRKLHTVLDV